MPFLGLSWLGLTCLGLSWLGLPWLGLASLGSAWLVTTATTMAARSAGTPAEGGRVVVAGVTKPLRQ